MSTATAKDRLINDRVLTGKKLSEAAEHLKEARTALLTWAREAYVHSNKVDQHLDHIMDVQKWAVAIENLRCGAEAKASIYGPK